MTDPVQIRIRPASDADASLWRLTREIAAILHPLPWVLVGGQMVAILEAEHGAGIGFATGDVDALVDVRAMLGVTLEGARRLLDAGFEPDRGGARGYRFVRDGSNVDVLAPDHLSPRAELRTVPSRHDRADRRRDSGPGPCTRGRGRQWRRAVPDPDSDAGRSDRHQGPSCRHRTGRPGEARCAATHTLVHRDAMMR